MAAQALLEGEAEGLSRKAIELALEGDTVALRLCLERLVPPLKAGDRSVRLELPQTRTAGDVGEALIRVLQSASEGDLTLGEAQGLASLLETRRRAIETEDLERRIQALEGART